MERIYIIVASLLICLINNCSAQSAGDYRSRQTGTWTAIASWETYNGTNWIDAISIPSSSNGIITILTGDTIISSDAVTVDQLVINNSAGLNITAGTFTINDGSSTDLDCSGSIIFSGGILNGAGAMVFNASSIFNWSGGTNNGTGFITINVAANLSMSGSNLYLGETKTINNYGVWTWTSGIFNYNSGSPIVNNYGTLNIYTDADLVSSNSTGSFNNKSTGTINKIGSPNNETSFSGTILFSNEGIINLNSSKLKFNIGSVHSGPITIAFGAAINFSTGNSIINAGTVITGYGNLNFEGGNVTLNAGSTIASNGNLNFTGGTTTINAGSVSVSAINISSGTAIFTSPISLDVDHTLNLTGGTFFSHGDITINTDGSFNMSGGIFNFGQSKTINNYGTWLWTNGTINYSTGVPIINNFGIFNIYTDADVTSSVGISGFFNNKPGSIINKIGSPGIETSFSGNITFLNEGTININSSKLKFLTNNAINNNTVNIYLGADINFSSGITNINAGSVISGNGSLNFDGTTASINAGSISVNNINISAGIVTLTPDLTFEAGQALNLSNATLTSNGNINFNAGSTFIWTTATSTGTGVLNINAGADLNMNGVDNFLAGNKTLNNYGNWNWESEKLYFSNGNPIINNYGTFNINADGLVLAFTGSNGTFNNKLTGIINKIGSPTGETDFDLINSFNNEGIVNVISGNLGIYIGGIHTGTYNIEFANQLKGSIIMSFTGNNFINNGFVTLANLSFDGSTIQFLNGEEGSINTLTINNTTGVMLTEAQTISNTININIDSKLTVYRDLIIQN